MRFNLLPVRIDHYRVMVAKGCGFSMFFFGGGIDSSNGNLLDLCCFC